MPGPLLQIPHKHSPSCGDPPNLDRADPDLHVGSFENEHAEQWLFTFHRPSRTAELRGGDTGSNESIPVHDDRPVDIILNASEQAWLGACWQAPDPGTVMAGTR